MSTAALHQPEASLPQEPPPATKDTSLSGLLGGVVSDLQSLFDDHLQMLRLEVVDDMNRGVRALIPMLIGGSLIIVALLMGIVAGVGCLSWYYPDLPWFAWTAIVATSLLGIGTVLLLIALHLWSKVHGPKKSMSSLKRVFQRIFKTRKSP